MTATAKHSWLQRGARAGAVLAGAAMLSWPSLWNGGALLQADSIGYIAVGQGVLLKLQGVGVPTGFFTLDRSEIYAASIYLLHHRMTLWPVVAVQTLLLAWVFWVAVRSLSPRCTVAVYLAVVGLLNLLTTVGWYTCSIMPDIFGPLLYLGLYVLYFAREELRAWETAALAALCLFAAAVHGSHLMIGACLLLLFAALWRAGLQRMGTQGRALLLGVAGLLLVAGTQMVVHKRLYGQASLFGKPPLYLTARLIGDGPGREYLRGHCATLDWAICAHVNELPTNEAEFLWTYGSIWQSAAEPERERLRHEQMPLVIATLRTYPREQTLRSTQNFLRTLTSIGPDDFNHWGIFVPSTLNAILPGLGASYADTRQAHDAMPRTLYKVLEYGSVAASMMVVLGLFPWCLRHGQQRLLGLATVVVFVLPANAFLSGVISSSAPRLQGRVAWMPALLAGLMVHAWWAGRIGARSVSQTPLKAGSVASL